MPMRSVSHLHRRRINISMMNGTARRSSGVSVHYGALIEVLYRTIEVLYRAVEVLHRTIEVLHRHIARRANARCEMNRRRTIVSRGRA